MSIIIKNIQQAVSSLKSGEVVAIPTETVYGLAANAEDHSAIRNVFHIKQRPLNHPLILHVATNWDLTQWVSSIPAYAYVLMQHFWPGPLTLVMPTYPQQNALITGGQDTIAVRSPNHPITQSLLSQLGVPVVAPSANRFGKVSPTTARHVQDSFKNEKLLILEGGRCQVGIESTIIDATHPEKYQILRQGMITEADINHVLPQLLSREKSKVRVSGQLATHYQPEKKLFYFSFLHELNVMSPQELKDLYVIAFSDPEELSAFEFSCSYQLPISPEQVAFELYYQLRQADMSSAKTIAIQLPPEEEKWQAIKERILKAGSMLPTLKDGLIIDLA